MSAWFHDPTLWQIVEPYLFPPERMSAAAEEIDAIAALLARCDAPTLGAGARVLDVPCGPGRHALAVAARGCEVEGFDLMERHVARARALAEGRGLDARFAQADMFHHRWPAASFDVALNLFTSLGYGSEDDDARLVAAIYDALRPGGALVVEMAGKELLARDFEPIRYREVDGWVVHERIRVVDAWQRIAVTLSFVRDGETRDVAWDHLVYGASDLRRLLNGAGFRVDLYGGLDGREYDQEAQRLVAVARKPPSPADGHSP